MSITNDGKKSRSQLRVEVFMAKMRNNRQTIPTHPSIPSIETRKLRAKLMIEETIETIRAMGIDIHVKGEVTEGKHIGIDFVESTTRKPSLIEVADGLADTDVVGPCGTASAFGIAHAPIKEITDGSNLMKFGPGHYFDADGKLQKPKDFIPPTQLIRDELLRQGAREEDL